MKCPFWFVLMILLIFVGFSCKKDHETNIPTNSNEYEYFPLIKGHWITYEVDSILYNPFGIDTVRFQVSYIIDSVYFNFNNQKTARIAWYINPIKGNQWTGTPHYSSSTITETTAETVEENQRIIKMVFPVKQGIIWNGNAYNNLGIKEYYYYDISKPLTILGSVFDTTVRVIQQDLTTLISIDYEDEVYAMNVGLISSKKVHLRDIQTSSSKNGYVYEQKVSAFGKK